MKNIEIIAKEIVEKGYNHVGVRSLEEDENYQVGDVCRESYEWDLEHDCSTYYTTGETAGGTCATRVDYDSFYNEEKELIEALKEAIKSNDDYVGKKVVIAGEYESGFGHGDLDEVRIVDAVVIGFVE